MRKFGLKYTYYAKQLLLNIRVQVKLNRYIHSDSYSWRSNVHGDAFMVSSPVTLRVR